MRPRGRFAPSPSGPLHFGSLVAAVGSYLQARSRHGAWLVRIEDLDPPREVAGAADDILRSLEQFGFAWDGPVLYQSRRAAAYQAALEQLEARGLVYPCTCSRRRLRRLSGGQSPAVYPGTCRRRRRSGRDAAIRVITDPEPVAFDDRLYGVFAQQLQRDVGDFIIRRRDGHFAYQLAVVVDDHAQGISEVVRGADLLDNTPRQIHLQRLLGLPTPRYTHLPVVLSSDGQKLSKQTGAVGIDARHAGEQLWQALRFLGQRPPDDLRGGPPEALWEWAVANWRVERIPAPRPIPASATFK